LKLARPEPGARQGRSLHDPDRAVRRGAADGAGAGGDEFAGRAAQFVFGVRAVQVPLRAEQVVEHAGLRVGGAQLAQHRLGRFAGPVDAALRLLQERAPAGREIGRLLPFRLVRARGEALDREQHRVDGRIGHLAAVEIALARQRRHLQRRPGPDIARVHLGDGREHGDAPAFGALPQRPVERRWSSVARRAGVDDQAGVGAPDVLGDRSCQHRRHDEPGRMRSHRFAQGLVVAQSQLDADGVAAILEFGQNPLRQAVECACDKQDVHGPGSLGHVGFKMSISVKTVSSSFVLDKLIESTHEGRRRSRRSTQATISHPCPLR
jgi:hypothetical protein